MKIRHTQGTIGKAILGFALLLGICGASIMTAQAQYRTDQNDQYRRDQNDQYRRDQQDRDYQYRQDQDRDGRRDRDRDNNRGRRRRGGDDYPNYGGSFQLRQTALNAGYNEGIKEGRNDRKKGRRYEFQNSSAYQKATKDYNSRDGDRELYRRYFQMAFENGYDAGYNGY